MKEQLQELCTALSAKKGHKVQAVVGMDGFVDEIMHLVDKRQNIEKFTRVHTLKEYGEMIIRAAGLSTNIEIVPVEIRLGGNGPYMSNGLVNLGAGVTYIGALGDPIHSVYKDFAAKAEKVYSLCEPGHNQALEFDDGKLMMLKPEAFKGVTWERVLEVVGSPKDLAAILDTCDLFGLMDWSIVFNMTGIWKRLIDEVFPLMKDRQGEKPIAFFDLSDPEKRTAEDILEAMNLIGKFGSKFRAVLGLNEKELLQIASTLGVEKGSLKDMVTKTYEKLNIYCLVAHPVKEACCCVLGEYYHVDGPYCEKPLTTTGAGDNFNSGFSFGLALGLDPVSSLAFGVSSSGFFVRNARSGTLDEITNFARQWSEDGVV